MTSKNNGLSRQKTFRRGKNGLEETHVWKNLNEGEPVVSRKRLNGMRSGMAQAAALPESTSAEYAPIGGGGSGSGYTNTGKVSYGSSGPSPAAAAMFGSSADNLARKAIPESSFGAQKWSLSTQPASTQRAMAALEDFRHVGKQFDPGTVTRAFSVIS